MNKLLIFLLLNIFSPISFAAEAGRKPAGKEEIVQTKKLSAVEQLSHLENLPWEKIFEIIDHAVDPLITEIQTKEQNILSKLSEAEKSYTEEKQLETFISHQQLKPIYEMITKLVDFRSNFLATSKKLSQAQSYIDTKIVKAIRKINQRIKNNLLGFAIFDDNESAISLLIQAGANLNALIVSPIGKYSIGTGENVRYSDILTYPLSWAVIRGSIPMAQLLIKKGAKVPTAKPGESLDILRNLVYLAAANNKLEMQKFLLDTLRLRADTSIILGITPLHIAANENFLDMVKLLLQHKTMADPKDNYNKTPLVLAALSGNKDIVELLLSNGADPNIKSSISFGAGLTSYTQNLIGALLKFIDFSPEISKDPAKKQNYMEIINLLREYRDK
ncbi:ankyrin repeat domain-containing protein [Candidatus Dependentiae bacterium]|nr:ankyrin repeat domain-containing protein [Candidatus Dependentiae bacterium]